MSQTLLYQWSVQVPPEAEEVVGLLAGEIFGQNPSFFTSIRSGRTEARLFLKSSAGLKIKNARMLKRFSEFRDLGWTLGRPRIKKLPRQDWADSWKKHFHLL